MICIYFYLTLSNFFNWDLNYSTTSRSIFNSSNLVFMRSFIISILFSRFINALNNSVWLRDLLTSQSIYFINHSTESHWVRNDELWIWTCASTEIVTCIEVEVWDEGRVLEKIKKHWIWIWGKSSRSWSDYYCCRDEYYFWIFCDLNLARGLIPLRVGISSLIRSIEGLSKLAIFLLMIMLQLCIYADKNFQMNIVDHITPTIAIEISWNLAF